MAGKGCTEEGGAAGEVRGVTRILGPLRDSCVVRMVTAVVVVVSMVMRRTVMFIVVMGGGSW